MRFLEMHKGKNNTTYAYYRCSRCNRFLKVKPEENLQQQIQLLLVHYYCKSQSEAIKRGIAEAKRKRNENI